MMQNPDSSPGLTGIRSFSVGCSIRFWLLFSAAIPVLIVCGSAHEAMNHADHQQDERSAAGIRYFETHIRPLLAQRCYSCHSTRSGQLEGGLRLDDRTGWLTGGDRGAAVQPGEPDDSLLFRAVRYQDPELQMPPGEPLSRLEIGKLEQWIRMGAPASEHDPADAATDPSDPLAGRQHWAFQPLAQTSVPEVRNRVWAWSDIDQFLLSRLEQEGLKPAADARPDDFLRRLSVQLTGLPPTPQQLAVYRKDSGVEATAILVDELLSSPQFGERWGRHWLDLARYADSNGLDENFLFREAWRYRNWVISAINADLPFDRFLLEQLAGDLLPYETVAQRDRQRTAAGFLVLGPKVLLGINPEQQRMDVADEQLETIGRVFLAQTLGCARCHDHKFDPLPAADYYAMAGILTSTQVMETRFMLNEQRKMERLVGLGEDGDSLNQAYEQYWRSLPTLKKRSEQAGTALDALKRSDNAAFSALLKAHPDAVAETAANPAAPREDCIAAQETLVRHLADQLAHPPQIPERAMIPADVAEPADEAIRLAGQFNQRGDPVPRGFLQVLDGESPIRIPVTQSGRIELSQWLTAADSRAAALTARVQANRIWHHLFGQGLVRTVDNFGRTGEQPDHPELLDHLARQLIDSGWSVKSLIRSIVLSRTFALSSRFDPINHSRDPENRLLWRAHRRRLDPEALRDGMLAAAGTLDLTPMNSTVWYLGDQATAVGPNSVRRRTDFPCRSVYLPVIRNDLPELFEVFNFANPHTTTGDRPNTTVPTQGLYLLNDEMVMEAAEMTARRIIRAYPSSSAESRIRRLFELTVSDSPTDNELRAIQTYLLQTANRLKSAADPEPEFRALALACHAVLASSRYQYLE